MSKEDNKYNYTPLPEPIPITEQKWPDDVVPLVHTRTMAYNHEKFIRECIEGLLMQKTTFPVQILIHDDASTDNTAEIIKEYEEKYPRLIKAYYQTENSYSKSSEEKGRLRKTFFQWITGKYQALCEGDDYWIDPLKLQKQVSFLEENEDYVLSHTNNNILFEEKEKIKKMVNKSDLNLNHAQKEELFFALIEKNVKIYTPSVVIRASYRIKVRDDKKFQMGDTPLWLTLSQYGKFHYLNEATVVYRNSIGTISRPKSRVERVSFRLSSIQMYIYYIEKYNYQVPKRLLKDLEKFIIDYIKLGGKIDSHYIKYLPEFKINRINKIEKRIPYLNKISYYILNPRSFLADLKIIFQRYYLSY